MGELLAARHSNRLCSHVSFALTALLYLCSSCTTLLLFCPSSRLTMAIPVPLRGGKDSNVERGHVLQKDGDSTAVLGQRILMARGGDSSSRSGSLRSLPVVRLRPRRRLLGQALESGPAENCRANFSSIDFGDLHGSCNQKHMTREGCCLPLLRIIGPRLLLQLRFMSTACLEGLFAAMTDQGIDPNDLLDFCLPNLSPRVKLGTDYVTQAQQSGGSVDQLLSGVVATAAEVYGHYAAAPGSEPVAAYDSSPSDYYDDFGAGYDYGDGLAAGSSYYPDAPWSGADDGDY
ncbi:hypothetical protein CBR_g6295 [Chara braunii]|uniref:Uncharacterized protein n=1 Tax=Chara braunii TaxID=69332 RepID=A0A388KJD6_CHABU|nr:hypothetical protein CBR_g6295 [Chara braunii]|eukprot:GBG70164.1 hypothetical protein CBR_g6295 [Chara braunii]